MGGDERVDQRNGNPGDGPPFHHGGDEPACPVAAARQEPGQDVVAGRRVTGQQGHRPRGESREDLRDGAVEGDREQREAFARLRGAQPPAQLGQGLPESPARGGVVGLGQGDEPREKVGNRIRLHDQLCERVSIPGHGVNLSVVGDNATTLTPGRAATAAVGVLLVAWVQKIGSFGRLRGS